VEVKPALGEGQAEAGAQALEQATAVMARPFEAPAQSLGRPVLREPKESC